MICQQTIQIPHKRATFLGIKHLKTTIIFNMKYRNGGHDQDAAQTSNGLVSSAKKKHFSFFFIAQ
jgi:hypothetical protein